MGQARHGSNLETDVRTTRPCVDRADPLKNIQMVVNDGGGMVNYIEMMALLLNGMMVLNIGF